MNNDSNGITTEQKAEGKNDSKNASKRNVKTSEKRLAKNRNSRAEIEAARNEEGFRALDVELDKLAQSVAKTTTTDSMVVERSIGKILELKRNGVGLEDVYRVMRDAMKLSIGLSSFRHYVSKFGAETGGKGIKRITVSLPVQYAEQLQQMVTAIAAGKPIAVVGFAKGTPGPRIDFGNVPAIKVELTNQTPTIRQ